MALNKIINNAINKDVIRIIVKHLRSIKDILNLRLVCKNFSIKLNSKHKVLWRNLVRDFFDPKSGKGQRRKFNKAIKKRPYEYFIQRFNPSYFDKPLEIEYIYKYHQVKAIPTHKIERLYETELEEKRRLKREKKSDRKDLKRQKYTRYKTPKRSYNSGGLMQLICW